ncbi:MAG: Phage polymerase-related protein [Bacteriovoracaceae bacterium]|nr:Phage polymerase-related protein [Bacteriovoracaceae bacterium]
MTKAIKDFIHVKEKIGAEPYLPKILDLPHLKGAVQFCRGCDLYRHATQAVFGDGSPHAKWIFLGEQPGLVEDRLGLPFVGPAGNILDEALKSAGIERNEIYVTNAVKHFKFERQGKRRLHKRPSGVEIKACQPWLNAEIDVIQPKGIVCLGSTAAQSIFGTPFKILKNRQKLLEHPSRKGLLIFITIHPASILRKQNEDERREEMQDFIEDLKALKKNFN